MNCLKKEIIDCLKKDNQHKGIVLLGKLFPNKTIKGFWQPFEKKDWVLCRDPEGDWSLEQDSGKIIMLPWVGNIYK